MYYRISKNEKILFFVKKIAQVWAVTLITTNKNMKKGQTPQDVYNKDEDQTVPPHNLMPVFIQPGMFYSFWRAILDYKTSYCL